MSKKMLDSYPTFIRALSTRDFGLSRRFLASGLGVAGLWARDESILPLSMSRVKLLLVAGEYVPFISVNTGVWLFLFHVPDCCNKTNITSKSEQIMENYIKELLT